MIKFVYFDVGGVLIKDFSKTDKWEQLKKSKNITDPNFDTWFDKLETQLCLGKVNLDDTEISLDDLVSRFEANNSIWSVIKDIKNKYKIGLLTNMYTGMLDAIKKRKLLPDVEWDIEIDSSIVSLQKPDPEIYKLAQIDADVKAEEILFVENSIGNVEAAKTLDWQTFLYDSGDYEKASKELLEFMGVK